MSASSAGPQTARASFRPTSSGAAAPPRRWRRARRTGRAAPARPRRWRACGAPACPAASPRMPGAISATRPISPRSRRRCRCCSCTSRGRRDSGAAGPARSRPGSAGTSGSPRPSPTLPSTSSAPPAETLDVRTRSRPTWPVAIPLLSLRGLDVRFRTGDGVLHAVKGVDLDVAPGETVAIVGESGSGKSQTAHAVMGLLSANGWAEGSVRYRGAELIGLAPAALNRIRGAKIAMIFQEPMTSLDPLYRVGDQIALPLIAHRGLSRRQARTRAVELLDLVRIADPKRRLASYPHELSGGQRQRVMIAMAIANDPDLLIADEPTTALDVTVQARILALLADLKSRLGMAMVFITHDLGIVRCLASRTYVMRDGEVVESGETAEIFARPRHAGTRRLIEAEPRGRKAPPAPDAPVVLEARDMRVTFALPGGRTRALRGPQPRPPRSRRDAAPAAQAPDRFPGPLRLSVAAHDGGRDRHRGPPRPRAGDLAEGARPARRAGLRGGAARPFRAQPLPARVLGRPAPAHRDRAGDDPAPAARRPRRTDLGARPLGPEGHRRAPARPASSARARLCLHQPRSRRRARRLRPDPGHEEIGRAHV